MFWWISPYVHHYLLILILTFKMVIVINCTHYSSTHFIPSINTAIIDNLTVYQKEGYCARIKLFNNALTISTSSKQFKMALKGFILTLTFYSVDQLCY
jgi:hypothetical protein